MDYLQQEKSRVVREVRNEDVSACAMGGGVAGVATPYILFYEQTWTNAVNLYYNIFVNDIFGTCVQAFGTECTKW